MYSTVSLLAFLIKEYTYLLTSVPKLCSFLTETSMLKNEQFKV